MGKSCVILLLKSGSPICFVRYFCLMTKSTLRYNWRRLFFSLRLHCQQPHGSWTDHFCPPPLTIQEQIYSLFYYIWNFLLVKVCTVFTQFHSCSFKSKTEAVYEKFAYRRFNYSVFLPKWERSPTTISFDFIVNPAEAIASSSCKSGLPW